MIRHYVGNRDTLVREATEHVAAQYRSRAAHALDEEGDALDVDALLDFFFFGDFVFGMPEQDRVIDSLLAAAASDPEACASLRAMYESFDELVRKHLTRCVPGAEPDRLAAVSWAIVCLLGDRLPRRAEHDHARIGSSVSTLARTPRDRACSGRLAPMTGARSRFARALPVAWWSRECGGRSVRP
jgi:AcrR family transcriptional regulator